MKIQPTIIFSLIFLAIPSIQSAMAESPLNFHLNAKQITQLCQTQIDELEKKIVAIESIEHDKIDFKNTFVAFDLVMGDFAEQSYPLTFFQHVSPKKTLRDASFECEKKVDPYFVDLYTRKKLYTVLSAFRTKEDYKTLNDLDKRLVDKTLLSFERSGMKLNEKKRAEYIKLSKELSDLQSEYGKNIGEYKDPSELSKSQLEGLPDSFLEQLEKTKDGKYIVTLAYPHYFPIMMNAKKASTRKLLQSKFFKRGGKNNLALFSRALKIRYTQAKLMGYKNHAEYVLEERMADNPKNVSVFLNDLSKQIKPKLKAELKTLLALKKKDDPKAKQLNDWDWRYYMNQLKKEKYDVDQDVIKEYFPTPTVIKGMFDIYQTLLGVTFKEVKGHVAWHKDVQLFRITDNTSKKTLAYFYMDLYPRDDKYSHAAAFTLRSGRQKGTDYIKPVSSIVANFPKPSKKTPSLLPLDQVETLLHEFGHIMHQTLTRSTYVNFSGTRVPRDFVEAPSQMLENWAWDEAMLNKLSGHYKNSKNKLPKELLDKMLNSKLADTGLHYSRQLMFALVDQAYHTGNGQKDPVSTWGKIQKKVFMIDMPKDALKAAGFGHLMGGYDSAYYGYLWSEVFASDMFTQFEKNGLLDKKTGQDYRTWILEKGGSQDAQVLIDSFLGRPSNNKAFIKGLGL